MEIPLQEALFTVQREAQPRCESRELREDGRWRRYFPPKRRFLEEFHDIVISQKTAFFNISTPCAKK
jgi:hypothetical protein